MNTVAPLELFQSGWDEGKWIPELDDDLVECSIIYAGLQASNWMGPHSKGRSHGSSVFDVLWVFKVGLHGFGIVIRRDLGIGTVITSCCAGW